VDNGYEMTEEEVTEGACAIAVPVFDSSKRVVAALTVLGPKYRMGKKQISNALQILRDSAKEISGNIPTELIALAR
jgi:DNA-binding IclR family transcriptional regulator